MNNTTRNNNKTRGTTELRPVDVERWEGEGGHPPYERPDEKIPKATTILRRFLINLRHK